MRRFLPWLLLLVVLAGIARWGGPWLSQRRLKLAAKAPTQTPEAIPPPKETPADERGAAPASPVPLALSGDVPSAADLRAAAKDANVLICVLDAARPDHFGAYGYPRDTTPNFDALAKGGLLFTEHFCQFASTTPSTVSLLTSQYPDTHGVYHASGENVIRERMNDRRSHITLEAGMKSAGLDTYLFSGNPAASPAMGVGDDFDVTFPPKGGDRDQQIAYCRQARTSPQVVIRSITRTLRERDGKRFVADVHFLPPHRPDLAPEELAAQFRGKQPPAYHSGQPAFTQVASERSGDVPNLVDAELVNTYDANLKWADSALGELIAFLKQRGEFENTLLIVTADHGEALGEHAYKWHVTCPYDEALRIPLLVKLPGPTPPVGRVGALTETVDLLPTLFDLRQIAYPKDKVQGRSLLPLLTGQTPAVRAYGFSQTAGHYPCQVVHDLRYSLLLYKGGKLQALYDLAWDPRQRRNLIAELPDQATLMKQVFLGFAKSQRYPPLDFIDPKYRPGLFTRPEQGKLSEEMRRELRSLGYLE